MSATQSCIQSLKQHRRNPRYVQSRTEKNKKNAQHEKNTAIEQSGSRSGSSSSENDDIDNGSRRDAATARLRHLIHTTPSLSAIPELDPDMYWCRVAIDPDVRRRVRCALTQLVRHSASHPTRTIEIQVLGTATTEPPMGWVAIMPPTGQNLMERRRFDEALARCDVVVRCVDATNPRVVHHRWVPTLLVRRLKMLCDVVHRARDVPASCAAGFPEVHFSGNALLMPFFRQENMTPLRRTFLFNSPKCREVIRVMFARMDKDINGRVTKRSFVRLFLDLLFLYMPTFIAAQNIAIAKQQWSLWTRRGRDKPDFDTFLRSIFEWPLIFNTAPHINEERYVAFWTLFMAVTDDLGVGSEDHYGESVAMVHDPQWLLEVKKRARAAMIAQTTEKQPVDDTEGGGVSSVSTPRRRTHRHHHHHHHHGSDGTYADGAPHEYDEHGEEVRHATRKVSDPQQLARPGSPRTSLGPVSPRSNRSRRSTHMGSNGNVVMTDTDDEVDDMLEYLLTMSDAVVNSADFSLREKYNLYHAAKQRRRRSTRVGQGVGRNSAATSGILSLVGSPTKTATATASTNGLLVDDSLGDATTTTAGPEASIMTRGKSVSWLPRRSQMFSTFLGGDELLTPTPDEGTPDPTLPTPMSEQRRLQIIDNERLRLATLRPRAPPRPPMVPPPRAHTAKQQPQKPPQRTASPPRQDHASPHLPTPRQRAQLLVSPQRRLQLTPKPPQTAHKPTTM
eukprot:PhM_4_TR2773/c0_g1_i1/m.675